MSYSCFDYTNALAVSFVFFYPIKIYSIYIHTHTHKLFSLDHANKNFNSCLINSRIWWLVIWVCQNIPESACHNIPSTLQLGNIIFSLLFFFFVSPLCLLFFFFFPFFSLYLFLCFPPPVVIIQHKIFYLFLVVVLVVFYHFSNVRNERGREMLNLVEKYLEVTPTVSSVRLFSSIPYLATKFFHLRILSRGHILFQGQRQPFVMETVKADDNAKLGTCSTFTNNCGNLTY